MLCVHLVYSIYYFREIFTFFVVLIVLTIKIYFENLILEYSIRSTDPQRYICFAEYPPYHSTIFTFSSCLPSHPTQDRHSPPYQTVKTIVAEPSCEDAPPRGPRRKSARKDGVEGTARTMTRATAGPDTSTYVLLRHSWFQ